jgi:hypothetical protein
VWGNVLNTTDFTSSEQQVFLSLQLFAQAIDIGRGQIVSSGGRPLVELNALLFFFFNIKFADDDDDDDDNDINLRPRGMVTQPPKGYRDVLS